MCSLKHVLCVVLRVSKRTPYACLNRVHSGLNKRLGRTESVSFPYAISSFLCKV